MSRLEELCRTYTELTPEDIAQLRSVERHLPLMAELSNADVFLDCRVDEGHAVVVAHARPSQGSSVYQNDVVGEMATAEKEPAVFHAFRVEMPVCDLKAITQEERAVRQNAAPVRNEEGRVIAVLIRERDISEEIQQEKKYEELARNYEVASPTVRAMDQEEQAVALREVHHRIKNNLQLVASILNLQARKSQDPELRFILRENVNRILSIASIHDILTHVSSDMRTIRSDALLEQLRRNLQSLIPTDQQIRLVMEGDAVSLSGDTATSVALVVVELVMNAIRHAFPGGGSGTITVSLCAGNLFHTVTVSDDGRGFDPEETGKDSVGFGIVRATVEGRLKGKLHITSDTRGTKVSFDFKRE